MLKIRLRRMGNRHRPFYRVVVSDQRRTPTAAAIEEIGTYDPAAKPIHLRLDVERADYWVQNGAQPSPTVKNLIRRARNYDPEVEAQKIKEATEKAAAEAAEKAEKEAAEKAEAAAAAEAEEAAAEEAKADAAEAPAEEAAADEAKADDAEAPAEEAKADDAEAPTEEAKAEEADAAEADTETDAEKEG